MSGNPASITISNEDVTFILQPVFESTKNLMQLTTPNQLTLLSSEFKKEIIEKFEEKTTKIYKIAGELIGINELIEAYLEQVESTETETFQSSFSERIKLLTRHNLLLEVDLGDEELKLHPDLKLMITPLGIHFLNYCQVKIPALGGRLDFAEALSFATQSLGSTYNGYVTTRITEFLDQIKSSLNKKEIVLSVFLLYSEVTSRDKGAIVQKSDYGDFLVPLKVISRELFGDSQIFTDITDLDGSIRRSTGVGGLEGKTCWYVKEDLTDKDGYLLYFKFGEGHLSDGIEFVVAKIAEGLKKSAEKDGNKYPQKALELLNKQINYHDYIYDSKAFIREKFLPSSEIQTAYLRRLLDTMTKKLS